MTLEETVRGQAEQFLSHFDGDEILRGRMEAVVGYDVPRVEDGIQDIVETLTVSPELASQIGSGEEAVQAYQSRVQEETRKHLKLVEEKASEILGLRKKYTGAVDEALSIAIRDLDLARDALSVEKDLSKKRKKREDIETAYQTLKAILPYAEPEPGQLMGYHTYEHLRGKVHELGSAIDTLVSEYVNSEMTASDVKRFRKESRISGFGKSELASGCKQYDFPEGLERLKTVWNEVSTLSANGYSQVRLDLASELGDGERHVQYLSSLSLPDLDASTLKDIRFWIKGAKKASQYADSLYFGATAQDVLGTAKQVKGSYAQTVEDIQRTVENARGLAKQSMDTRKGNKEKLETLRQAKGLVSRINGQDISYDASGIDDGIESSAFIENEYSVLETLGDDATALLNSVASGVSESLVNQYIMLHAEAASRPEIEGEYRATQKKLEQSLNQMAGMIDEGITAKFVAAQAEGRPIDSLITMAEALDSVYPHSGMLEEMRTYVNQLENREQTDERITVLQDQISEGKRNVGEMARYITDLKNGHSQEIGALTEQLSLQGEKLTETQVQMEERIRREKENLRRELSGGKPYSLGDYLREGAQPYSFSALKLQNAATSGKPWMERLQDLSAEIEGMAPMWHTSDVDFSKRLYQGIEIEAREGELKEVLGVGPRKEVYGRIMGTLKNYIAQSEKAL
jgi:hypothetical protein